MNPNNGNFKQNQTFFHGTYSNLTPYLFLSKNIKFLSFLTKVNANNGNKTNSDICPLDIFKSDTISFFIKKILSISMTFKIKLSQFFDQNEPK